MHSEQTQNFKTGDMVRLKSGGPAMKINGIHEAANVCWKDEKGETHYDTFPLHCIEAIPLEEVLLAAKRGQSDPLPLQE